MSVLCVVFCGSVQGLSFSLFCVIFSFYGELTGFVLFVPLNTLLPRYQHFYVLSVLVLV
jgi:hypothetical protein